MAPALPDTAGVVSRAGGGAVDAVAFGVAADLVYNIFSATNSSPQTTELFAGDRADTLWKYVRLGGGQSILLVGIMAYRASHDGVGHAVWPVFGGALAGVLMWGMYSHALKAGGGTKPPGPGQPAKSGKLSWSG